MGASGAVAAPATVCSISGGGCGETVGDAEVDLSGDWRFKDCPKCHYREGIINCPRCHSVYAQSPLVPRPVW